jgi:hypothetical protein
MATFSHQRHDSSAVPPLRQATTSDRPYLLRNATGVRGAGLWM